jgi:hypothetical protein
MSEAEEAPTQPEAERPEEPPEAVLIECDASACDGAGWYHYDGEYPDEGVVGAFRTIEEARTHASEAGYVVHDSSLPECRCQDWWFPEADRAACRALPHGNGLVHHASCPRVAEAEGAP